MLVFSMLVISQLNWGASHASAQAAASVVEIRWFIGLGGGMDPAQVVIEQQVADDFNASHPGIHLSLETVDNATSKNVLRAEIANGNAPDLVGPVGWSGANSFHGQWLDLASRITSTGFNTSIFAPGLVEVYNTDEGQIGLPFAEYPSALYSNPELFTAAGLNPPPAHYGDLYEMPDHSMVVWSWDTLTQMAKLLTLDSTGKNATQTGFDKAQIIQYGFSFGWEGHPNYWGSYWKAGSILNGSAGSYTALVPAAWKTTWQWVYEGMWGAQPYIPNGPVANSPDFGSFNVFNSGKIAMLDNPSWYLCCMSDLVGSGKTFQFGAMPSYGGSVAGRVDADTFRILKTAPHPDEAFTLLTYLVTTGVDKLIIGTSGQAPAYGGAVSAITAKQAAWKTTQAASFPFVTSDSWNVMLAGLNYPDDPSAEGFMPNQIESWARLQSFGDLLNYTEGLDLAAEETTLEADLTSIFNSSYLLISGNAGVSGVTLSYYDDTDKTATSISDGTYAFPVSSGWSGTVTPSKAGAVFSPAHRTYTYVLTDKTGQNYTASYPIYLPLVIR
jgi:multiple sugar transport system substrate-binding protein